MRDEGSGVRTVIATKVWKFVLILIIAIVALGAMFALGRSEFGRRLSFGPASMEPASGLASGSSSDAASTRPQRKAWAQDRTVILPSADIPAADAIAQLKDAADHGSARASCRIAFELSRCEVAARSLDAASVLSNYDDKKTQKTVKWILDSTDADAARCTGVSSELISKTYHYQAIAAQSGDSAMQRWLMQKPALDPADFLSHLDEWGDYERRVKEYAPAAVHRKQLDDLMFLALAYVPQSDMHFMAHVFIKDNATFLAFMDAVHQNNITLPASVTNAEESLRNSLPASERKRYETLSSELSDTWEPSSAYGAASGSVGIMASACEQVAN